MSDRDKRIREAYLAETKHVKNFHFGYKKKKCETDWLEYQNDKSQHMYDTQGRDKNKRYKPCW